MKDVMGLIFTGENDIHLGELTSLRAVAALPIAGGDKPRPYNAGGG